MSLSERKVSKWTHCFGQVHIWTDRWTYLFSYAGTQIDILAFTQIDILAYTQIDILACTQMDSLTIRQVHRLTEGR